MKLAVHKDTSGIHISVSGHMYVEDASQLREKALEALGNDGRNVVVDMSGLEYIDSSGMGVLISIHKRCVQRGGGVTIRGLHGTVQELFELTRLTKVFTIS